MKNVLISRKRECEELQRCLDSNRSEQVIVHGRRRIGKTYLINNFFNYKYDFTFVDEHNTPAKVQIRNFARALQKRTKVKIKVSGIRTWYDAFNALEDYLETLPVGRKKVIFIDEMPWMDTQRSHFVNALENFWNGWANRRTDIMLVATGAATSWMGLSFELLCLCHHRQIKSALGIAGVGTSVSTWKSKADEKKGIPGFQIDMIIERADRMIHLCEQRL